jgi:thiamine biosynthesis lipoprotein ApbE
MRPQRERVERFECFGATVSVRASGDADVVRLGLRRAREVAEEVHRRLTRFDPASDLCRLNADPRELVPAAPLVRRFAQAVRWAGEASGGLGKGLAADLMAAALSACGTWAIDCGGDLRVGGLLAHERAIDVADPDGGAEAIHRLQIARGAVATSGVTRRAWAGGHHLVDPRSGRAADTGIAQVTAVARTGLEAEVRAKTALLAGPAGAAAVLVAGGVYVTADGELHVVAGDRAVRKTSHARAGRTS